MPEIKPSTNDQPTHDVPLAKTVSANGTEHTTSSGDTTNTEQSAQTISSNGSIVTYTDPHADVSLISLGDRVFKVQSFVLKAQSTYFLAKLNDEAYKGDPIHVPAHTRVLKFWLDLAHLHNRPPKSVWSMREPLFKLCEYLGSRGVAERALLHMNSEVEHDPWALFVLASQKKNVGLAKSALRSLATLQEAGDKVITIGTLTPSVAEGVALPYLIGLYAAALAVKASLLQHDLDHGGSSRSIGLASPPGSPAGSLKGDIDEVDIGWKAIADNFHPILG